jgi:hypothetical protein
MTSPVCELLDGYLGRWLSEPELQAFVAHLASCPLCRQAVDEQRRFDQLLSQASTLGGLVPAGLVERIEGRLVQGQRRRLLVRTAALAAVLLLAVGISIWIVKRVAVRPELVRNPPAPAPMAKTATPVFTRVALSRGSGLTAVPIESHNPGVTIVWLFPDRSEARVR